MEQTLKQENVDNISNQDQTLEFNKIQGFDVLEKLPEESKMRSYNEEYYSSLSNLKFISVTIPEENKLFYHFEHNPNASVTTTTGQMYVCIQDLLKATEQIRKIINEVEENIQNINGGVENCDQIIFDEINPQIRDIETKLKKFLVEQKTENFKLIKEIAILQKEKAELVSQIGICSSKLDKIEKEIGSKRKQPFFPNKTLRNNQYNISANNTYSSENPKAYGDCISVK